LGQDNLRQREMLPIAAFALKADRFDGIYLGRRKGDDLVYAGKVDHGFDTKSAKDQRPDPCSNTYATKPIEASSSRGM
jgi:hypothetical protein